MSNRARTALAACCLLLVVCPGTASAHIDRIFACFVYIEPYEVRVEFVTTTATLALPLSFEFDDIHPDEQEKLAKEAGPLLAKAFAVSADGKPLTFEPDYVGFVRWDAEAGTRPDERETIPIYEALMSGIFVCRREDLPRQIEVRLNLFDDRQFDPPDRIPLQIELLTSPADRTSVDFRLSDNRTVAWELPASAFSVRTLADTAVTQQPSYAPLYLAGGLSACGLILLIVPVGNKLPRRIVSAGVLTGGIAVAAVSLSQGMASHVEEEQAKVTIESLLTNVYHGFAYRDELKVFDTLATSVDGPLLESLYLDIKRGLSDAENGGPRVRVLDVEVQDCEFIESMTDRLHARVRWVSAGTVSHWGHAHNRRNQYHAEVVAVPIDGTWRLTSVEILEEARVD